MKKYILVLVTTLFTLTAMTAMVLFMKNRDIEAEGLYLTDGINPDGTGEFSFETEGVAYDEGKNAGKEGYFRIPLEDGIGSDDVRIISNTGNDTTVISIPVTDPEFYYTHNLSGSSDRIQGVKFSVTDKGVAFDLQTDDLSVPETVFENGSLFIRFVDLTELYDYAVFIDAGHGGEDSGTEAYGIKEKDISLGVASKIEGQERSGTGIFFSRTDDSDVSDRERADEAKKVNTDYIISIHTNADKDTRITRGTRVLYNDDKIKEKAENLAKNLGEIQGIQESIAEKSKDDTAFSDTKIPCIVIKLGYMTNKSEAELMADEEFQEKAAEAIEAVIF